MSEPVTIRLHNCSFQLKEHHDFRWLEEMGEVFAVFDQQDSGNLSPYNSEVHVLNERHYRSKYVEGNEPIVWKISQKAHAWTVEV